MANLKPPPGYSAPAPMKKMPANAMKTNRFGSGNKAGAKRAVPSKSKGK